MSFDLPFELPDGWEIKTVEQLIKEEIIEKPLDGNHGGIHPKSSDYVSKGIPFVMASDLHAGRVDLSGCKFITEKQANTLRKGFAKAGDVLISHKATIGRTAIVQQNDYPYVMLTPQVTYYRIIDDEKLSNIYLKAYFDSPFFQSLLALWAGSGSTRAYLGITGQLKLPVIVPPIDSQKHIANYVFTFNEKIELNTQTNQTLEQIAQALFKSWFVDFDPVKAKIETLATGGSVDDAELAAMRVISAKTLDELNGLKASNPEAFNKLAQTAALFPAAMQDSELGDMPEGWRIKSIYDICNVIYGAPFKSKLFNTDKKGLPLVRIRDLKNESPGVFTEEVHSKGYLIQNGDIVVGMDGEFRPYIWGGNEAWMNQRVCCFKPTNDNHTYLVRNFIDSQLSHFEKTATATTVIHLGKGDIDTFSYIDAGEKIFNLYSEKTARLCEYFVRNKIESLTLSQLRDSLLPKLLSGEIDFTSEVVA